MKINKLRFKKIVYGLQQGRLISKLTQTQKLWWDFCQFHRESLSSSLIEFIMIHERERKWGKGC